MGGTDRTRSGSRIIWLSLTLLTSGTVLTFGTGHHADLTHEVLTELGMNDMAIRAAQTEN